MEFIGVLIMMVVMGFVYALIVQGMSIGGRAVVAAGKSAFTGDSFQESFRGIPNFKIRIKDEKLQESGFEVKEVQIKGLIPVDLPTDVGFVVILRDVTGGKNLWVVSLLDQCQSVKNSSFCHSGSIGLINEGVGFPQWVKISAAIPLMIQPPYSGEREIKVEVVLFDENNKPEFSGGTLTSNNGIICQATTSFFHTFIGIGYKEADANKKESESLTVEIAMGLAFEDGSFDKSESKIIKDWALKNISCYPVEEQQELKVNFNNLFKDSYEKIKLGSFNLDSSIERLSKIGDKKSKFDAVELCHAVMAADGEIDQSEVQFIDKIATRLDLSAEALKGMKDSVILNLKDAPQKNQSLENILGIDSSWSSDEVRVHLRKEFQKWNNRINTLPEGSERERAQDMLDSIAEARKKYKK